MQNNANFWLGVHNPLRGTNWFFVFVFVVVVYFFVLFCFCFLFYFVCLFVFVFVCFSKATVYCYLEFKLHYFTNPKIEFKNNSSL